MSSDKMVEMARDVSTSEEQLAKLCKSGNHEVLESLVDNLNTPDGALYEATLRTIVDKKLETRRWAAEVIIYRIRHNRQADTLPLKWELVHLLKETDWIRGQDILRGLGELGATLATDTICMLMHTAFRNYRMYKQQETFRSLEGKLLRMKTDTDTAAPPSAVYWGFVASAIAALGKIGDPEALHDLASIREKDDRFKDIVESAIGKITKERE